MLVQLFGQIFSNKKFLTKIFGDFSKFDSFTFFKKIVETWSPEFPLADKSPQIIETRRISSNFHDIHRKHVKFHRKFIKIGLMLQAAISSLEIIGSLTEGASETFMGNLSCSAN